MGFKHRNEICTVIESTSLHSSHKSHDPLKHYCVPLQIQQLNSESFHSAETPPLYYEVGGETIRFLIFSNRDKIENI